MPGKSRKRTPRRMLLSQISCYFPEAADRVEQPIFVAVPQKHRVTCSLFSKAAAIVVAVLHLAPACGERSRASCERVRGTLDSLTLADTPPHPDPSLRSVSDLSPQAGRGEAASVARMSKAISGIGFQLRM